MPRILRRVGLAVGGLAGIVAIAAVALYVKGDRRLDRRYAIAVAPLTIPTDDVAVARGRHLAEAVALCTGCHGNDLSGGVLVDEPWMATIYASNLTAGRGGVGTRYTDADYVRAIRHGVHPTGRGLMIMHADAYHHFSAADLGAVIAYVKSVPPVDNQVPATRGAVLGKILVALGLFDREGMPLLPAEVIDHAAPFVDAPPPGATAAHGEYLVSLALCRMCHGADLHGGAPIEEGAPPGPDIAARAAPGAWSEAMFIETIRTGTTPYGKALDENVMPWKAYHRMSDDELGAIWRYLASLSE